MIWTLIKIIILFTFIKKTSASSCTDYSAEIQDEKWVTFSRMKYSGYVWPDPTKNPLVARETAKTLCKAIGMQRVNIFRDDQRVAVEMDLISINRNQSVYYGILGISKRGKADVRDKYFTGSCQGLQLCNTNKSRLCRRPFNCQIKVTPICQAIPGTQCFKEQEAILKSTMKFIEKKKAIALQSTPRPTSQPTTLAVSDQLTGQLENDKLTTESIVSSRTTQHSIHTNQKITTTESTTTTRLEEETTSLTSKSSTQQLQHNIMATTESQKTTTTQFREAALTAGNSTSFAWSPWFYLTIVIVIVAFGLGILFHKKKEICICSPEVNAGSDSGSMEMVRTSTRH